MSDNDVYLTNYELDLEPNCHNFTFRGRVDGTEIKKTKSIKLNTIELKIKDYASRDRCKTFLCVDKNEFVTYQIYTIL